jgi:hypothetical protein
LKPHVTIEGAPESGARILGAVTGASGAGLYNLRVENPAAGELFNTAGSAVTLRDVTFAGSPGASGVLVEGAGASSTVIDRCTFTNLAVGIEITDALPIVRRSIFEGCGEAGILVHGTPEKAIAKTIGDQTDARTGWNTFRDNETFNVVNERAAEIAVELNDWSTDSAEAIANAISGALDFNPFVPAGKGILAASLFCTVWDSETQARIGSATVSIAPGTYTPVTENEDGVYAFPALPAGTYTVEVAAPGFGVTTVPVSIGDGELLSVTVPLGGDGMPPGGCACNPDAKGLPTPGDMVPAMMLFLVLAVADRRRRR